MRKIWILFFSICFGVVLHQLMSLSRASESSEQTCASTCESVESIESSGVAHNIPTHSTAVRGRLTLWTAHSILTSPMDGYHYAIIRSIMHHAQPTVFYLHASNANELISAEFSRKLNDEYPNIEVIQHEGSVAVKPSFADIQKAVSPFGSGVYISLSVFLQPSVRVLLATQKCLVDRQELVVLFHKECPYFNSPFPVGEYFSDIVTTNPANETAAAIALNPLVFHRLQPYTMDSMAGPDKYCNLVVMKSLEAMPHPTPVIPNIVHYVWFSSDATWQMTFLQLISVLSNLKVNRVETVFIYSNVPPSGPHWDWLRDQYGDRIQHQDYPQVTSVFGTKLSVYPLVHSSDVVRLQVLKRFGGSYFDWDAIALKSHEEFRYYDAVMGSDAPFTDGLASQHVLFRSESEFLSLYLNNYKEYDPHSWSKNAIQAPKDIFLKYPYLLKVPDRFILSPFSAENLTTIYDQSDVFGMDEYYAFHYVSPEPEDHFQFELNFESVAQLKGTFGTILRHVINHP